MVLKLWQQTDRQNRTEWQLAVTREAADYYYFGKHPRISGLSLFLDAHYDYENAISRSRALSLSLSLHLALPCLSCWPLYCTIPTAVASSGPFPGMRWAAAMRSTRSKGQVSGKLAMDYIIGSRGLSSTLVSWVN